jgi:hypothetical protein
MPTSSIRAIFAFYSPIGKDYFMASQSLSGAIGGPKNSQTMPNGGNLLYGAFASIVTALALEAVGVLGLDRLRRDRRLA